MFAARRRVAGGLPPGRPPAALGPRHCRRAVRGTGRRTCRGSGQRPRSVATWTGRSPSWRSRCSASPRSRGGCPGRPSRRRWSSSRSGCWWDPRCLTGSTSTSTSSTVRALAEATLALVLFCDASRIDLAAASPRGRRAAAPARHRAAADDRARRPCGGRDLRTADRRGGRHPGGRPGADRRRAGAGRRHRAARPGADPPGAQRRERAQRRDLRAAAVRGRGGGRRGIGDLGGPQRRDAAARGDRLRHRRRRCRPGS